MLALLLAPGSSSAYGCADPAAARARIERLRHLLPATVIEDLQLHA
ncbi:hypothetical protein [Streptomyces sp. PSAA01]|nr:hypothetical protein [Streptomyces sp. PSAA01]MCG0283668.1 hypothetical protein [Streptomyces sp. PSAA01]